MTVLLINTAGAEGIVALADAAKVRAAEILPARGTSEGLMPAIRRLFPDGLREVTAVGVVNGARVIYRSAGWVERGKRVMRRVRGTDDCDVAPGTRSGFGPE